MHNTWRFIKEFNVTYFDECDTVLFQQMNNLQYISIANNNYNQCYRTCDKLNQCYRTCNKLYPTTASSLNHAISSWIHHLHTI